MEATLVAAFIAGLAGSGHCIGMCGPIVLLIERDGAGIGRRLAANVGRLGFYVVLGGIAAAFGVFLTSFTGVSEGLFMLRTAAGVIIILLGLHLLFDLRLVGWLEKVGSSLWQRMSPFAKHVMPANTIARSLGAGFIWGALPCGLVYSAVVLAATAGGASGGAMVMTAFWLGTLPSLLLAGGMAKRLASVKNRKSFRIAAGTAMILSGAIALAMPYWHAGDDHSGHHSNALVEAGPVFTVRRSALVRPFDLPPV